MKILRDILKFLLLGVCILIISHRSDACDQEYTSETNKIDVIRIESESTYLFILSSDTIIVSKTIGDLSIIFQLVKLYELFFQGQEYHSISIRSLSEESKKSNKKKKYFKAEGYIPNRLNPYEWLIRIENANATRKMDLKEFLYQADAALVEIKIQI